MTRTAMVRLQQSHTFSHRATRSGLASVAARRVRIAHAVRLLIRFKAVRDRIRRNDDVGGTDLTGLSHEALIAHFRSRVVCD